LTRGQRLDAAALRDFIAGLPLPEEARQALLKLTPGTYTGVAARLARDV
jgi:adenylosuccinate lyase